MASTRPVKRRTSYSRRKRFKDFMSFIASKPCACCGKRPVEVAHCGDDKGMAMKCSDLHTLPLCAECHRTGKKSHHQMGRKFFEYWGIEKEELFKQYQDEYAKQVEANERVNSNEAEGSGDYNADKKWALAEYARERRIGTGESKQAGDKESDFCGEVQSDTQAV